jgi:hypothetical protein
LTAVLFHELVHVAGGWELDAEYFENLFFPEGKGATRPTYDDWPEFKEDKFQGWWVYLNTRTGHAMDLWKNDLGEFMKAVKPKKGVKLANK